MYGELTKLGFCKQNSYNSGGPAVNSIWYIPYTDESLKVTIPPLISKGRRSQFDENESYAGPRTAEGDVGFEVMAPELGLILSATMADSIWAGPGQGTTMHSFTPRNADWSKECASNPVSIYREFSDGDNSVFEMFYDMAITKTELTFAMGEFVKAKVSFVGGTLETSSAQGASYNQDTKALMTWDVSSFSIGGVAKPEIIDMTITIDEKLEAQHLHNNSLYPARIKRKGTREIAVAGTIKFEDRVEYDEYLSQTERSLLINCQGNRYVGSGNSIRETLRVEASNFRIYELSPQGGGEGPIEVSITGALKYNVSSASAVTINLIQDPLTY